MEFRADMHCHSTCSDGSLTPIELVELAKERGLSGLSITDHDTIEAYDEPLFRKAEELGIKLCSGVEFSCQLNGVNVHLLGYDFDIRSPEILELCQKHQKRRKNRNTQILNALARIGFVISYEEVEKFAHGKVIGRPHIAHLMVNKGYVPSIKKAFDQYIGDNQCCYSAGESFSCEETIEIIHKAKGKAFIAHPHLIKKGKIVKALLDLNFDGIECYYALFRLSANDKWLRLSEERGWLVSGGSDFHGDLKPMIPLGASYVNLENFEKINSGNLDVVR